MRSNYRYTADEVSSDTSLQAAEAAVFHACVSGNIDAFNRASTVLEAARKAKSARGLCSESETTRLVNAEGLTPLMVAVINRKREVVAKLLTFQAIHKSRMRNTTRYVDINYRATSSKYNGKSVLEIAADMGNAKMVMQILYARKDKFEDSAKAVLFYALKHNQPQVALAILNAFNVSETQLERRAETALNSAAAQGNAAVFGALCRVFRMNALAIELGRDDRVITRAMEALQQATAANDAETIRHILSVPVRAGERLPSGAARCFLPDDRLLAAEVQGLGLLRQEVTEYTSFAVRMLIALKRIVGQGPSDDVLKAYGEGLQAFPQTFGVVLGIAADRHPQWLPHLLSGFHKQLDGSVSLRHSQALFQNEQSIAGLIKALRYSVTNNEVANVKALMAMTDFAHGCRNRFGSAEELLGQLLSTQNDEAFAHNLTVMTGPDSLAKIVATAVITPAVSNSIVEELARRMPPITAAKLVGMAAVDSPEAVPAILSGHVAGMPTGSQPQREAVQRKKTTLCWHAIMAPVTEAEAAVAKRAAQDTQAPAMPTDENRTLQINAGYAEAEKVALGIAKAYKDNSVNPMHGSRILTDRVGAEPQGLLAGAIQRDKKQQVRLIILAGGFDTQSDKMALSKMTADKPEMADVIATAQADRVKALASRSQAAGQKASGLMNKVWGDAWENRGPVGNVLMILGTITVFPALIALAVRGVASLFQSDSSETLVVKAWDGKNNPALAAAGEGNLCSLTRKFKAPAEALNVPQMADSTSSIDSDDSAYEAKAHGPRQ